MAPCKNRYKCWIPNNVNNLQSILINDTNNAINTITSNNKSNSINRILTPISPIDINLINNNSTNNKSNIINAQNPSLSITKNSNLSSFVQAGQMIKYQYTLINNGDVTINNIMVDDDKIPGRLASYFTLIPGGSIILYSYWITTAADVINKSITNTVTASSGIISTSTTITVPYNLTAFTLSIATDVDTYATAGQVLTYTFKITNTGTVPIIGPVKITDTLINQITPNNFTNIAVGASVSGTSTYTVWVSDIRNGLINNTATAYDDKSDISVQTRNSMPYSNPLLVINRPTMRVPTGTTKARFIIVGGGGAGASATDEQTAIGGGGGGRSQPVIMTIPLVPGVDRVTTTTGVRGNPNNMTGRGWSGTESTVTYNGITYTAIGGAGGYTFAEPNGGSVGGGGAAPNGLGNHGGGNASLYSGGNGIAGIALTDTDEFPLPYIFVTTPGIGGSGGRTFLNRTGAGGGGAGGLAARDDDIRGQDANGLISGNGGEGYGAGGGGGSADANFTRMGAEGAPGIVVVQFL